MPEVPVVVKFDITNACKVAFYYTWQLGMTPEISCKNAYNLTVSQKQGHVISDDRSTCYLTMTTYHKVTIKDHCVLLKVTTFSLTVKGSQSVFHSFGVHRKSYHWPLCRIIVEIERVRPFSTCTSYKDDM